MFGQFLSQFWVNFRDLFEAQSWPQRPSGGPKMRPKLEPTPQTSEFRQNGPQNHLKLQGYPTASFGRTELRNSWSQDGFKMPQDGPRMARDGPKMAQKGPKITPKNAKDVLK